MSLVIFALTAANLSLYLAFVLTAFPGMLPCALAAALLGSAACAGGCLVSRKAPKLRFLFLLLPPLALLPARDPSQMLYLAPAVLYPEMILLLARFSVSYWSYRSHYLWSGCVLLLLMFFAQTRTSHPLPALFGAVSLTLGAFALRQLRFGAETGLRQKGLELLSLCALPAGLFLFTVLASRARQIAAWLSERLFYPLALLLREAISFLDAMVNRVKTEVPELVASASPEAEFLMPEQALPLEELPPADDAGGEGFPILLILLAAAAALCLAVFFYRRLRDTRSFETLSARENPRTEADDTPTRVPGKAERQSNRRKVRRLYEKYLKLLRRRSFSRLPQDSSLDVFEKTRSLSPQEPAQALRELYILARYRPDAVVTGAQVREARLLLRKLREDPGPRDG